MFERELAVMQGESANERVTAIEVSFPANDPAGRKNYLELRFEHHAGELGWVTQRRIPLSAHNISDLRSALTLFCASNPSQCVDRCRNSNVVQFSDRLQGLG